MTKDFSCSGPLLASLAVGTVLSFGLTGCMTEGSARIRVDQRYQTGPVLVYQDDYDYYPDYGVYYGRNRHEFVYRDGNAWVRRTAPLGVSARVLLAAPSVRMDFRDGPEHHDAVVAKRYPKNWKQPVQVQNHPQPQPAKKEDPKKRDDQKKRDDKKDRDDRHEN